MNTTQLLENFEDLVEKNKSKDLEQFVQTHLHQILNHHDTQEKMAKILLNNQNNIYWIFKKKFQGRLISILTHMIELCSWYLEVNSTDVAYLEKILLDMNKVNFTDDVVRSWFGEFSKEIIGIEKLYIPFIKRLYHSNRKLCTKFVKSMKDSMNMYGGLLQVLFGERPDIQNYYSNV